MLLRSIEVIWMEYSGGDTHRRIIFREHGPSDYDVCGCQGYFEGLHFLCISHSKAFAMTHQVHSLPAEQLLDIAMCQLHPGRPAVIALPRMRRDLHLAEQR